MLCTKFDVITPRHFRVSDSALRQSRQNNAVINGDASDFNAPPVSKTYHLSLTLSFSLSPFRRVEKTRISQRIQRCSIEKRVQRPREGLRRAFKRETKPLSEKARRTGTVGAEVECVSKRQTARKLSDVHFARTRFLSREHRLPRPRDK